MSFDTVTLYIDNTEVQGLKSYNIRYDLFQGAGSFEAEINRDYIMPLTASPVQFRWVINGFVMMKGYIDKVDRTYSKDSHSLRISGRDMMQVLIDNYILSFETYKGLTITQIIDKILRESFSVSSIRNLSYTGVKNGQAQYDLGKPTPVNPALALPQISVRFTDQAKALAKSISAIKQIRKGLGDTLFGLFQI